MEHAITYVGLDVHKDTIAVAIAETGRRGEVREHGKIANTPTALKGLVSRLTRSGAALQFCYEAGPCGYRIQRQLTAAGHGCVVVAPSLIPRKPGDRIKTDRRDATNLAKLHRAGELTPVWVPDPAHEAVRDLLRARLAAVRGLYRFGRAAGLLRNDPAALLDTPRLPRRLPRALSRPDATALVESPRDDGPRAWRDRAMLELLYGSGLRASEVAASATGSGSCRSETPPAVPSSCTWIVPAHA